MRIGIFGGTFNPPHIGHLRAAEESREVLNLNKVIFIPSGSPPLKSSELISSAHRYAMTVIATANNLYFEVSDIECRVEGRSYSIDTIKKLKAMYAGDELVFILGIDAFLDLPSWRSPDELTAIIDFAVISRPPFDLKDAVTSPYLQAETGMIERPHLERATLKGGRSAVFVSITHLDISATMIRNFLKEGRTVKYLLPQEVESYIISNRLYIAH